MFWNCLPQVFLILLQCGHVPFPSKHGYQIWNTFNYITQLQKCNLQQSKCSGIASLVILQWSSFWLLQFIKPSTKIEGWKSSWNGLNSKLYISYNLRQQIPDQHICFHTRTNWQVCWASQLFSYNWAKMSQIIFYNDHNPAGQGSVLISLHPLSLWPPGCWPMWHQCWLSVGCLHTLKLLTKQKGHR